MCVGNEKTVRLGALAGRPVRPPAGLGNRRRAGRGWCGIVAGGCALLVVVGVLAAWWLYHKTIEVGRHAAASGIEFLVGEVARQNLPPAEAAGILAPISSFTARIRTGNIGLDQVASVSKAFVAGPILPGLMARAFECRFVQTAEMPEVQRQAAHTVVARFTRGMMEGRVPSRAFDEVSDILTETVQKGKRQDKRLRKQISPEELQKCLGLMAKAADAAGVPADVAAVDLAAEITRLLADAPIAPPAAGSSAAGSQVGTEARPAASPDQSSVPGPASGPTAGH
ncbi:MAG: hypothetical protein GX442_25310 [Candidatus Riflebacteria bacterium]|nr:hypothetical protein [Candidatus Riflebacteria bacterium]